MRIVKTGPVSRLIRTFGKPVQSTGSNSNRKSSSLSGVSSDINTKHEKFIRTNILSSNKNRSYCTSKPVFTTSTFKVNGSSSKAVCPNVLQLAQEIQDRLMHSEVMSQMQETASINAKKIVEKYDKTIIRSMYFPNEKKLDNLLNAFMKNIVTRQGTEGYSEEVDRYFKASVTLEAFNKDNETELVGGMDLISSIERGTPIVTLPSRIKYNDGVTKVFNNGLKNDRVAYENFKSNYMFFENPTWGEGRLMFCKPGNINKLMEEGMKAILYKDWSGCFALANERSPLGQILKTWGFEEAGKRDKNAIDTIEFLGGEIPKLNDKGKEIGKLKVPRYTEKNENMVFKVYFIPREKVLAFFSKPTENRHVLAPKYKTLDLIHA